MTDYVDENGYMRGKFKHSNLIHRQIAYHNIYLKNRGEYTLPFSKYVVHHIDKNKRNNDVSNLQLVTKEEHDEIHGIKSSVQTTNKTDRINTNVKNVPLVTKRKIKKKSSTSTKDKNVPLVTKRKIKKKSSTSTKDKNDNIPKKNIIRELYYFILRYPNRSAFIMLVLSFLLIQTPTSVTNREIFRTVFLIPVSILTLTMASFVIFTLNSKKYSPNNFGILLNAILTIKTAWNILIILAYWIPMFF